MHASVTRRLATLMLKANWCVLLDWMSSLSTGYHSFTDQQRPLSWCPLSTAIYRLCKSATVKIIEQGVAL